MLIKSSTGLPISSDIRYGEVVLNLDEARLYTLDLNNNAVIADYPRYLTEFKDFIPTTYADGYLVSTDGNTFSLQSLPFIGIAELGGTANIDISSGKYLALMSGKVTTDATPIFSVFDLGDVRTLSALEKSLFDGFVLTYTNIAAISTKDYFTNNYLGQWTLMPELKSVRLAQDIQYTLNIISDTQLAVSNYRILRQLSKQQAAATGRQLTTDTLHVSADPSPTLGGNLSSNKRNLIKRAYSVHTENVSNELSAVTISLDKDITSIYCTIDVLQLTISFSNVPTSLDRQRIGAINVYNLTGSIVFSGSSIVYENGFAVPASFPTNIYTYCVSNSSIQLLHRASNLTKTNYAPV